jgi:hypothetical protein
MSDEKPPFFVGQRVRFTQRALRCFKPRTAAAHCGAVVSLVRTGNAPRDWNARVKHDGHKRVSGQTWCGFLEPVPPGDLGLDETCRQLVAAYHAGEASGDYTAALLLADRIIELRGGS